MCYSVFEGIHFGVISRFSQWLIFITWIGCLLKDPYAYTIIHALSFLANHSSIVSIQVVQYGPYWHGLNHTFQKRRISQSPIVIMFFIFWWSTFIIQWFPYKMLSQLPRFLPPPRGPFLCNTPGGWYLRRFERQRYFKSRGRDGARSRIRQAAAWAEAAGGVVTWDNEWSTILLWLYIYSNGYFLHSWWVIND